MSFIASKNAAETTNINNWVKIASKTFNNANPSGDYAVLNYSKVMVEIQCDSCNVDVFLTVNRDSQDNYITQKITADDATISGNKSIANGFLLSSANTPAFKTIVFENGFKSGHSVQNSVNDIALQHEVFSYTGNAMADVVNIVSSGLFSGKITLYKWEQINAIDLHSWEEIKTIKLNKQAVDEVITIDGDVSPDVYIDVNTYCNVGGSGLQLQFNGSAVSYYQGFLQQYKTTPMSRYYSGQGSFSFGMCAVAGRQEWAGVEVKLTTGMFKFIRTHSVHHLPDAAVAKVLLRDGYWASNDKVTSFRLFGTASLTGTLTIYKRVKSHLITTNPNTNSIVCKYIDGDNIQVQPGELEVNGIVCNVPKPVDVNVTSTLRSGITKIANSNYYLYAIKNTDRSCSYVIDNKPPLMDRYKNEVATFAQCNTGKAWYHPELGMSHRFIKHFTTDENAHVVMFDDYNPVSPISGHYILNNGTSLANRNNLNFIGFGITQDPDNDAVKIAFPDLSPGHDIANSGSVLPTRRKINFVDLVATDDSTNNATNVSMPNFTKGHIIQQSGVAKAVRSNLNFTDLVVTDDAATNSTIISMPSFLKGHIIQQSGTSVTDRAKLNFSEFTLTDDATNNATVVSMPTILKPFGYKDKFLDLGSKTANFAINVYDAVVQKVTIAGDCTITFSGWDAGYSSSIVVSIVNGGSFATVFSGVKWQGGLPPTLTGSGTDRLVFVCDDGVTVYGFAAGLDMK